MMKKIGELIASTAIPVLLAILATAALDFIVGTKISYLVTNSFGTSGDHYVAVVVSNYSSTHIDDVRIVVPVGASDRIQSSQPVTIKKESGTSRAGDEVIEISGLPSRQVTMLIIPMPTNSGTTVDITNAAQKGLEKIESNQLANRVVKSLSDNVPNFLVMGALFLVANFFFLRQLGRLDDKLEEASGQASRLEANMEKSEKDARELRSRMTRLNLYSTIRVGALQTELSFWRDTIRKFLYSAKGDQEAAAKLFESVTDNLKTYAARSERQPSFSEIEALAQLLTAREKTEIDK